MVHMGNVVGWSTLPNETFTHSFNTNELYKGNEGLTCFANGALETQILDIAKLN